MKKIENVNKSLGIVILVLALVPVLALGATMKAGEEVAIPKGNDVEGNLYVAAGNVSINSIVSGDLYTAGGNVLITENVSNDIVVAGGSVTILGDSGDDVRVAGGNVLVVGNVGGELIAAGGSITVASDVSVGGDVVTAGGQITLDGTVVGDVEMYGGVATVNGRIQGNLIARVEDKLTIGSGAVIDGNLAYKAKSADALKMGEGAIVTGEIVFEEIATVGKAEAENFIVAVIGVFILFKLASFVIVALILIWLFKNFSNSVVRGVVQNPLRMLGYGFVTLIVAPAAAILLFVTLLGIPLGIMVLLSYGLLMLVSAIYAGVTTGAWMSQLMHKAQTPVVTWKNVLGGTVLLTAVTLVPIVGWIVGLLLFLVTLGSITDLVYRKLWSER